MEEMRDDKDMPSTDGRREITARVNAKEGETVRQAQKLASKTKQLSASNDEKRLLRSERVLKGRPRKPGALCSAIAGNSERSGETEEHRRDHAESE